MHRLVAAGFRGEGQLPDDRLTHRRHPLAVPSARAHPVAVPQHHGLAQAMGVLHGVMHQRIAAQRLLHNPRRVAAAAIVAAATAAFIVRAQRASKLGGIRTSELSSAGAPSTGGRGALSARRGDAGRATSFAAGCTTACGAGAGSSAGGPGGPGCAAGPGGSGAGDVTTVIGMDEGSTGAGRDAESGQTGAENTITCAPALSDQASTKPRRWCGRVLCSAHFAGRVGFLVLSPIVMRSRS
jgi:hypothetical protein